MTAAILILCGPVVLLTSCTDDDGDGKSEQQKHEEHVKAQLEGNWYADADGADDVDMSWMNLQFKSDGKMVMNTIAYNYEQDDLDTITVNYTYEVLPADDKAPMKISCKMNADDIERVEQLLQQQAKQQGTVASQEDIDKLKVTETISLSFDVDTMTMVHIEADDTSRVMRLKEPWKIRNKEYLRSVMREIMEYSEMMQGAIDSDGSSYDQPYGDFDYSQYSDLDGPLLFGSPRRAQRAEEVIYGLNNHRLDNWMSKVKDDTPIYKMLIPGTHDAATYNMWWGHWMWTMARSQGSNIPGQFNRGIRCFDLRTRYQYGMAYDCAMMFHNFIAAGVSFSHVTEEIVECIKKNPTEGVIIMVKVEGNDAGIAGKWGAEDLRHLAQGLFPLGCNFQKSEPVKTLVDVNKTLKAELYDKGLLATFKPGMTMKDLRGKALVLIQNPPLQGEVDYGVMKDMLAIYRSDGIYDMNGKKLVDVNEQNDWEQNKDAKESEEEYVKRKTIKFRNMLQWCIDNPNAPHWVYNAANGYFWEAGIIPDYATFAQQAYPIFTDDIARLGDVRGIVLVDYVGQPEFKRVSGPAFLGCLTGSVVVGVAASFFFGGPLFGVLSNVLPIITGIPVSPLFLTFCVSYGITHIFSPWKYPKTQELVNTMVEVNLPEEINTGLSDDPIDYARAPKKK